MVHPQEKKYTANGKLLLTAEYFVTDGAIALALPTKLGQHLTISPSSEDGNLLQWVSYHKDQVTWFEASFDLTELSCKSSNGDDDHKQVAETLTDILLVARKMNPDFLPVNTSLAVETHLDFDRNWGLGSSSTLIDLISQWANVDPFRLLMETFGGSGYDIAAARASGPILFQKFNGKNRWDDSPFNPHYKDKLYFVYLGKKQNTKEAMVHYIVTPEDERIEPIGRINQITHDMARDPADFSGFNSLLEEHELLVQMIIKQPRAKELYFDDFWGEIKSLGGWGGDFVLATSDKSNDETLAYFKSKGHDVVFTYGDLILEN